MSTLPGFLSEVDVIRYTDEEIARFVLERKVLPRDYLSKLKPKTKKGHSEQELDIRGEQGSEFRIMLRQSLTDIRNFSAILKVKVPNTNVWFKLKRYNGVHEHTNCIEKNRFRSFHIHCATQRYQEIGASEEHYASVSDGYSTLQDAVKCLLRDCGFVEPKCDGEATYPLLEE